jgi:hypothetical protein
MIVIEMDFPTHASPHTQCIQTIKGLAWCISDPCQNPSEPFISLFQQVPHLFPTTSSFFNLPLYILVIRQQPRAGCACDLDLGL